MSTATTNETMDERTGSEFNRSREVWPHASRERDAANTRVIERTPRPNLWLISCVGTAVPIGMATAAVAATYLTTHERVAMTAWICTAVVGTAAVIASAQRRTTKAVQGHRSAAVESERRANVNVSRTK